MRRNPWEKQRLHRPPPPPTPDQTAMDAETSPTPKPNTPPTSSNSPDTQATQATSSASYAEAAHTTQELFTDPLTEPSSKRAPSSPAKGDRPVAQKSMQPPPAPPLPQHAENLFLTCLIKALTKSGLSCTCLMMKVNGDVFYNFCALHLQHTYRNLKQMDGRAAIMRQLSSPEKERWS